MGTVETHIDQLDSMRVYPTLEYLGNLDLLKRRCISIVGTRRPSQYTRSVTFTLAQQLSSAGFCIVSGCAMGVDAIAHHSAGSSNTIAIMGNGLDIRYPKVNASLIQSIEEEGLCLSPFAQGFKPTKWSFVQRNEIVAALGECLIVTEADLDSGTLHSVEFALRMNKRVYVIPHRMGESEGTNRLLLEGKAEAIYDVEAFIEQLGPVAQQDTEGGDLDILGLQGLDYEAAYAALGEKLFEYELEGKVEVLHGRVFSV